MFNIGDKVFFSLAGKDQFPIKSNLGIVLKVGDGHCSVLGVGKGFGSSIYHNRKFNTIRRWEDREEVENEIINYYNERISEWKGKLKVVTREIKDTEKFQKYEKLKQQTKVTAKHLYESEDDLDFENKLKAICQLKKQIYAIELDCVSNIRKYNGHILYEIKELEKRKSNVLKDISEETIKKLFVEFE